MQSLELRNSQRLSNLAATVKTSGYAGGLLAIDTLAFQVGSEDYIQLFEGQNSNRHYAYLGPV
jgi:hypothetical protein